MEDIFMLGPLMIRQSWLIMLAGLVVGFIVLRLYPVQEPIAKVQEILLSAFVYFLLIWQFSTVLFSFDLILREPLSIFFYPSGLKEFSLGLLLFFGYVWWQHRQQQVAISSLLAGMICVGAPALFVYYFVYESYGTTIQSEWLTWLPINQHPLHVYQMAIYLILMIAILLNKHRDNPLAFVRWALIWWGGVQWGITLVDPYLTWFGMSVSPYVYGLVFCTGLIWESIILMKKRKVFSWLN